MGASDRYDATTVYAGTKRLRSFEHRYFTFTRPKQLRVARRYCGRDNQSRGLIDVQGVVTHVNLCTEGTQVFERSTLLQITASNPRSLP